MRCRILFVAGMLACGGVGGAQEEKITREKWDALPDHPRLFATDARFTGLKQAVVEDPATAMFYGILKKRADGLLEQEPVVRVMTGKRLLAVSRQAQECILVSALVARISGEGKYRERALREMRALAGFPDWNRPHFLDVAEATFGLAVGYDWLYDSMTPEDRRLMEDAILEKGLKASFPVPGGKEHSWIKGTNNWNQVCHAGMVAGALAVRERDPEMAKVVVERAVANLGRAAKAYAPDGVYPEGPMYWNYGTSFHVALVAALRAAFGDTFGMERFPGFMKTPEFYYQAASPTGRFFNFADCSLDREVSSPMFWFSRELKRPELLEWEWKELEGLVGVDGSKRLERTLALGFLWMDPRKSNDAPPAAKSWIGEGKVPVALHRSAWNDPQAAFLATKGGSPAVSHGHMDIGSFVYEVEGIRWAVDPGMQNYFSLESKGVNLWGGEQDAQRWKVFRLGPESHGILRFNGAAQLVKGRADFVKSDVARQLTVLDLTGICQPEAASATRGVRLLAGGGMVVRDEWKTGAKQAEVTFQWITRAKVQLHAGGAILSEGGKSLTLTAEASSPVKVEVDDVSKPVRPYDEPNPGMKRIRFVVETAPAADGFIAVTASKDGTAEKSIPLESW